MAGAAGSRLLSKRHRGKTCVYCGATEGPRTADHVFARTFFPVDQRGHLPQVAACAGCNGAKAAHEHYLATVLPFGGRTPATSAILTKEVPRRLERNLRLHRELAAGQTHHWSHENGMIVSSLAIPFDGERFAAWAVFVVKGLAAHHWDLQLAPVSAVRAGMLVPEGEALMRRMIESSGRDRVVASLGEGLVDYEGVRGIDDDGFSIWRIRLYGGVQMSEIDQPGVNVSTVWATTSRPEVSDIFAI